MGPAEDIENHNVGGQIQNAFAPQDAADQGDPHEAAVGIHAGETLNLIVPVFFFGDQHSGHGDACRMGENGQQAGEKKSLEKMGGIFNLERIDDHNRIDDQQKQIGEGFVAPVIHDAGFETDKACDQQQAHFYNLIGNNKKHFD